MSHNGNTSIENEGGHRVLTEFKSLIMSFTDTNTFPYRIKWICRGKALIQILPVKAWQRWRRFVSDCFAGEGKLKHRLAEIAVSRMERGKSHAALF